MLHPGFESLVDRRFGAIAGGKLTPLTAGAGEPDQAIEDGAGVPCGTPAFLAGLVDDQDRREPCPQFIGDFPERSLLVDLGLVRLSRCHSTQAYHFPDRL